MTDEETFAEVNRIANAARFKLRDDILDFFDAVGDSPFTDSQVALAVVVGAATAATEVLKGLGETGAIEDPGGKFEMLLRQMADVWGQAHGFPHQPFGSVQQ